MVLAICYFVPKLMRLVRIEKFLCVQNSSLNGRMGYPIIQICLPSLLKTIKMNFVNTDETKKKTIIKIEVDGPVTQAEQFLTQEEKMMSQKLKIGTTLSVFVAVYVF